MAIPARADYHIHHYLDVCAHKEMTLENIEIEAVRLGLEEICILKHYSARLPNDEGKWVNWHRIVQEEYICFLEEIRSFRPSSSIRMLAGVETELIDDEGGINIPKCDADKVDTVNLSVHWMPDMDILRNDPRLWPGDLGRNFPEAAVQWCKCVRDIGAEAILERFVFSYIKAIEKNPKVRVLAHMDDGLSTLRSYRIPVDELGEYKLLELMEPLMKVCADKNVLWELTPVPVKFSSILKRANELGVHFSATADAHFLSVDGWANLRDHDKAENYIALMGLTKGSIRLCK